MATRTDNSSRSGARRTRRSCNRAYPLASSARRPRQTTCAVGLSGWRAPIRLKIPEVHRFSLRVRRNFSTLRASVVGPPGRRRVTYTRGGGSDGRTRFSWTGCSSASCAGFVETGTAPHYAELARALGLGVEEGRVLLQDVMRAYPIGWLHPETDYIASFPPLNNLPTQYRNHRARRATLVRPVRVRGDLGHLALSRRDGARRRAMSRLRRSGERRDARRPDRLGRSARSRGTPQLRFRSFAGPAAVSVNGHEPLPVGRARATLAGLSGALGRRLHRSRGAGRFFATESRHHMLDADYLSTWYPRRGEERRAYLERIGKTSPFWLGTPDNA